MGEQSGGERMIHVGCRSLSGIGPARPRNAGEGRRSPNGETTLPVGGLRLLASGELVVGMRRRKMEAWTSDGKKHFFSF